MKSVKLAALVGVLTLPLLLGAAKKADPDPAMFGGSPSRNMVSSETGLPATWDMETGLNIKWTLSDVRNINQNVPLAVFALPPTTKETAPIYRQARKVFKKLDADVVTTEKTMGTWARRQARSLTA